MEEDYPRSLLEMERRFATEDACREYLAKPRWGHGFLCPACEGKVGWEDRRHRWTCQSCQRQTTVTAGTIFEGTHLPLQLWFRAVWLVTSQKSGASALVGNYVNILTYYCCVLLGGVLWHWHAATQSFSYRVVSLGKAGIVSARGQIYVAVF